MKVTYVVNAEVWGEGGLKSIKWLIYNWAVSLSFKNPLLVVNAPCGRFYYYNGGMSIPMLIISPVEHPVIANTETLYIS